MAAGCRAGGHKKDSAAIEQYEAAEKLDAKDVAIRNSLGRRAAEDRATGRGRNRIPRGARAAAHRRCGRQAHKGLVQALLAQKKIDEAATELGAYLAAHPNDPAMQLEHASLLVDAGKYDEALAELDKAAAHRAGVSSRAETSRPDLFRKETV